MHRSSYCSLFIATFIIAVLVAAPVTAQNAKWPTQSGDYIAKNFHFLNVTQCFHFINGLSTRNFYFQT